MIVPFSAIADTNGTAPVSFHPPGSPGPINGPRTCQHASFDLASRPDHLCVRNQHGASTLSSDRHASATDLHVIAAGAFEHVLHALAQPFRQESGHALRLRVSNAGGVIRK